MSILDRNPTNPNFLQPNKFQLSFSRAPALQYFCQAVTVPGISTSEIPRNTPFVDLYVPGEKAIYDIFNVTFLVDESLQSWLEIHDWIRGMTFPKDFTEYQDLSRLSKYTGNVDRPQYSDATLTIMSSANTPTVRFKMYDCFPTSISAFVLSSQESPDNIITADAAFRFSYYDIEKLI
jgi:hypothetical protein